MMKLIFAQRRRPGLSREDYHSYLADRRAAGVAECRDALGLQGYVQLRKLTSPLNNMVRLFRSTLAPCDGIEEFSWDSSAALSQALDTPAGKKAAARLIEEEKKFVDRPHSALWFVQEHVIVKGVSRVRGQQLKILTWVGHGLPPANASHRDGGQTLCQPGIKRGCGG